MYGCNRCGQVSYREFLKREQFTNRLLKNAQCKKCLNKFNEKDIYTIQQFQYRKEPPYEWTIKFFNDLKIGEWDSFCEKCIREYSKLSDNSWKDQAQK